MDSLFEIDQLKLYFGEPYIINEHLTILQPKIKDIVDYGERQYYTMVSTLCAIPSDMKSDLYDMGLDYEKIGDFELFTLLTPTLPQSSTGILLGDADLSKLRPYKNPQNDMIVLADRESGLVIDEIIYQKMVNYIRQMNGLKKKVEHAANEYTKKFLIDEDRRKKKENKNKEYKSFLFPMISAIKVRNKYTREYVQNMGIVEFFDDVARAQIINNADAFLSGMYSGMIDVSKIPEKDKIIDWMRELDK